MQKSFLLSIILLVIGISPLWAQLGDLTQDKAFFEQQSATYQRWLEHSGLSPLLQVHAIDVQSDQLSLFLSFPFAEVDSIIEAWNLLKDAYEREHLISLEQQLFYKMVQLMEVRQSLANVQIYDTYDLRKEPLFFRGILFKDGKVQVESSNPKAVIKKINLRIPNLANATESARTNFHKQYPKSQVFTAITAYARRRYEQEKCELRFPKLTVLEDDEVLRFEVVDLCKEVLIDEENPAICNWLRRWGHDCNWIKRELLTFTVSHLQTYEGIQLEVEIDGKVGSGYYDKVKRGGYMDMEVDFKEYLERYAASFAQAIKQELLAR